MWAGDVPDELEIDEEDDGQGDRLFTFEVTKTNEQEESVVPRPGITVSGFISISAGAKTKPG